MTRLLSIPFGLFVAVAPLQAEFFVNEAVKARPADIRVDWSTPAGHAFSAIGKHAEECVLKTRAGEYPVELHLSFPTVGGVRVHNGRPGFFEPQAVHPISYTRRGDILVLKAGTLTAELTGPIDNWQLKLSDSAEDGVEYTLSADRIFWGFDSGVLKKSGLKGSIKKNEMLFGLGERFNALNQVGHRVQLWNRDSYNGLMTERGDKTMGYKNVPLLHSSRGWSLFFNSYYSALADIGKLEPSIWSMDFNGPKLDVFVWLRGVRENLKAYTELTGRPVLPPRWALRYYAGAGGQVWKERGEARYLDVLRECLEGYRALGTPIAALYGEGLPCKNSEGYDVVVKEYGSRMLYWYWSAMGFRDMQKRLPHIPKTELPAVYTASEPDKIMRGAYIDFSHPLADDLIYDKFKPLWKLGCRGSMVDFGDNVYEDSIFHNGMTGDEMHNAYAWYYNKGYFDAWERGKKEGLLSDGYILFSRSGAAGSQRWLGQFAGDHESGFMGLRQAVLGGLNAGASAFSLWGSDIGGYGRDHQPPSPDCYMRWFQFGTFSPLMRIHGTTDRNPWSFGDAAVEVYTKYYWLRENLLPSVYSGAVEAHRTGLPMIQSMPLAFPDQPDLFRDDQYLFCDRMLVAPVLHEGSAKRIVAFPKGTWVDLWNGNMVQGGDRAVVKAPQDTIPVYLPGGTALRIQVAPSLRLFDPMPEKRVEALLVAAGGTRVSRHWSNKKTVVEYRVKTDLSGAVAVELPKDTSVSAVVLLGKHAESVQLGSRMLKAGDAFRVYDNPRRTVVRLTERLGGFMQFR